MKRQGGAPEITREVLAYLVTHPQAQDTVEGITRWWLLEEEITRRTADVRSALAELVSRGFVMERHGKDGAVHYRINQVRREEIRAFLKERSDQRTPKPVRRSTPRRMRGPR